MTPRDNVTRWALIAAATLLLMLLASYFFRGLIYGPLICAVIIILFEVVVPVEIIRSHQLPLRSFNIYAHNIDTIIDMILPPWGSKKTRPDFLRIGEEIWFFAKFSCAIFIPYVVLYWVFFAVVASFENTTFDMTFTIPPMIFYELITQIFVVALPEELFYRGFLQSALLHKWPNHTKIAGFPVGRAIILTNIIFALGHVAATLVPLRLLTFFPGMLFSYLVYRNKSLLSAVLFHACCNILGQILYASH